MRGGTDADRALPVIAEACGLGFSRVKALSGEHGAVEATVTGRGRYVVKWTWHPHSWPHNVAEVTARLPGPSRIDRIGASRSGHRWRAFSPLKRCNSDFLHKQETATGVPLT